MNQAYCLDRHGVSRRYFLFETVPQLVVKMRPLVLCRTERLSSDFSELKRLRRMLVLLRLRSDFESLDPKDREEAIYKLVVEGASDPERGQEAAMQELFSSHFGLLSYILSDYDHVDKSYATEESKFKYPLQPVRLQSALQAP